MPVAAKKKQSLARAVKLLPGLVAGLALVLLVWPWINPLKLSVGGHGVRLMITATLPGLSGGVPRRWAMEGLADEERSPWRNWAFVLPGGTRAYVLNWW